MHPFIFSRPADKAAALQEAGAHARGTFLAGGTNLVDLMKQGVEHPTHLVDINRLPLDKIEETAEGLRIGALVRNSDLANHELIQKRYPLLSQALLSGASPQLRNAATVGGNLMQRTRCYYFYDTAMPCNKRDPGTGCGAREGFNRIHAIFGASEQCVAVHPSDMCVALAALDASIEVESAQGTRNIPIGEFHRLPGVSPHIDNSLVRGELITAVKLPASPYALHSYYLKIRDRASYDFALVSVAAALEMVEQQVRSARLVLGGVASKPWRLEKAEKVLTGGKLTAALIQEAAEVALQGAEPLQHNQFKVELAKRSIVRALQEAIGQKEKR